jgi:CRISPR/Cas system CSM-associated protein Csm5 (group 7 of RAMP superfamily)
MERNMKLKLARTTLKGKPKIVEIEEIIAELATKSIFYFDKENSHKELKELIEFFEEKGYSVYMREVKYGLDENEYVYEVHII